MRQTAPQEHPDAAPAQLDARARPPARRRGRPGRRGHPRAHRRRAASRCRRPSAGRRRSSSIPTSGDHDYALVHLDPVSLAFALERLPELPDPLLRQQVWSTLWEMVRDATARLDRVPRRGPAVRARRDRPRARCSPSSSGPRRSCVATSPTAAPTPRPASSSRAAIEVSGEATGERRLIWARTAVAAADGAADVERSAALVDGGWARDGFEPDQEMRWQAAIKAAAFGLDGQRRAGSTSSCAATHPTAASGRTSAPRRPDRRAAGSP